MRSVLFAVAAIFAWYVMCRCDLIWQRAPSSDRSYRVRHLGDSREAASLLDRLSRRVERLIGDSANADDPRIQRIRSRWNGTLTELDGRRAGAIAHSIGKRSISVCIRNPDGTLCDEDSAFFVVIHEMAHIANSTLGHDQSFWDAMRFLLELGEYTGVYHYKDHDVEHVTLCGKKLGTNPMTCVKDGSCSPSVVI